MISGFEDPEWRFPKPHFLQLQPLDAENDRISLNFRQRRASQSRTYIAVLNEHRDPGRAGRPSSWARTPRSGACSSRSRHKSTDVQQKSIALGKEMPKCSIVAGRKGLSAPLWLRAICKTPGQNVVRHSCSPGCRQRILHNGSSVPAGAKICCTSAYLCHLGGMRKRGCGKILGPFWSGEESSSPAVASRLCSDLAQSFCHFVVMGVVIP